MKLLRLDLLAVGPFTGETLEFPPDSGSTTPSSTGGLHIVYGPNEAGKSSALRAVRHALFGFPARTTDSFRHPNTNLRVGALLEAADGSRLEFIRRKANAKTVRGPDDADPIDETRLTTLLGGIDAEAFARRYGIDHDELRRGGEAIARGQGEIADILFAAGAGLADVRAVQSRLDERAAELFKYRGKVSTINQLLSRLTDVRKAMKEASLSTSEWIKCEKSLHEETARQGKLLDELSALRAAAGRLDRARRSIPLVAKRRGLLDEFATVADAALLPDTFTGDRRETETRLSKAKQDLAEATREIERIEAELAQVRVPTPLLEQRAAIADLHTRLGGHTKAADDRPGLVLKLEDLKSRAESLLAELGRPRQWDQAESLKLPKPRRQRIQDLGADFARLIEKKRAGDDLAAKLREELARVREGLERVLPAQDMADLDRAIKQAQKEGDLDDKQRTLWMERERLRQSLETGLAALPLFRGTTLDIARMSIPSAETVDRFENEWADATRAVQEIDKSLRDLDRKRAGIAREREALRLEGEVPSEADLTAARTERSNAWEMVVTAWQEGRRLDDAAAATSRDTFLATMARADTLADRLRREAERVEKRARLDAELMETEQSVAREQVRRDEAVAAEADVAGRWRDLWTRLEIEPLPPREMRVWRTRQQALAADAVRLEALSGELSQVTDRVTGLRGLLANRLARFNPPPESAEESLSTTLDRAVETRERVQRDARQREASEKRRAELEAQLADAERSTRRTDEDLAGWKTEWTEAVSVLGLGGDARPSEANAVVTAVDELFALLKEARDLESRIAGIDADAEGFRTEVASLVAQVASDLAPSPAERLVRELHDRLDRAGKDQTQVQAWERQLRKERTRHATATADIAACRAKLDQLRALAGGVPDERLHEAEEQSRRRREIETELRQVERQLLELAGAATLDEWLAESAQWDADRVAADLDRLGREIGEVELAYKSASEHVGEHRGKLADMNGGHKAADLQGQSELLLAGIRSHAEDYVRLRLAGAVLTRAMERFRESAQDPVLARASALFSTLTLNAFSGLRQDFDDKGTHVLLGLRAGSGETVSVDGMSDGTCDQLYLAVRLALLEPTLANREPLPVIVDDILVLFDDDRAVAALKVLAEFAERTQVIFFTHHGRIVELAESALPAGTAHVVRLDRRSAG
jgi:uncharacterized protein YhaN